MKFQTKEKGPSYPNLCSFQKHSSHVNCWTSIIMSVKKQLCENWRRGQKRFCPEARGERSGSREKGAEMAQTMYAHMNK
jgi:hypothetical protein